MAETEPKGDPRNIIDKIGDWGVHIPPQLESDPQLSAIYAKLNKISMLIWWVIAILVAIAFRIEHFLR